MAVTTCLPKEYADALRSKIDEDGFSVNELAKLPSTERRARLKELFRTAEEADVAARKGAGLQKGVGKVGRRTDKELDEILTRFNRGFEERIISSSRNLEGKVDELKQTISRLEDVENPTPAQKSQLSRSRTELKDLEGSRERLIQKQRDLLNRYVEREMRKATPKAKKRTVDKINELNYLLDPSERQVFLEDFLTARFGFSVTSDTRKMLLALSKDSSEAIGKARAIYDEQVPQLADYYKKTHPEGKATAQKLDSLNDPAQKKFLKNMLDRDAEEFAYDVLQGWRGVDPDAPLKKADQMRIQKELTQLGIKSQRLVDFIGFQQRTTEALQYAGSVDEFRMGNYYQSAQLAGRKLAQKTLEGLNSLKSITASIDVSILLRQGLPVLFSNPKTYFRQMGDAFRRTGEVLRSGRKSKENIQEELLELSKTLDMSEEGVEKFNKFVKEIEPQKSVVRAEIAMRPNSINGKYAIPSNGFSLNVLQEEAFPTSLPGRIPAVGRAFAASEFFFEAMSLRWRANLADQFIWQLERKGIDWTKKETADELGLLISSLTGRGLPLGAKFLEGTEGLNKTLNATFFSPRFTGSRIYFWSTPFKFAADATDPVKQLAAKQFASVVLADLALMGTLHMTAKTFWGEDAGVDFRLDSPSFGHLKYGNYAYDLTGAGGSYLTLLGKMWNAREGMRYDNKLGIYVPTSWGTTAGSTLLEFFTNKASPGGAFVRDIVNGHGWGNTDITSMEYIRNIITPLSIQIPLEAWEENDGYADAFLVLLGEALGVSSRSLNIKPMSKEWKRLKEHDRQQYYQAMRQLNDELFTEVDRLRNNRQFQEMEREEQDKEIASLARRMKSNTVDEYLKDVPEVEE